MLMLVIVSAAVAMLVVMMLMRMRRHMLLRVMIMIMTAASFFLRHPSILPLGRLNVALDTGNCRLRRISYILQIKLFHL